MPKVEVDEAQFNAQKAVSTLLDGVLKNPEARRKFHDAVKTADPTAVIPEVDAKREFERELAKEREARLALEKRIADREAKEESDQRLAAFTRTIQNQEDALRQEGWMDDGIEAVKKLAQERAIPDLEAAAALYRKINPPNEPVASNGGYGSFDFFQAPQEGESPEIKKLLDTRGDDEGALRSLIQKGFQEVRTGTRNRRAA